MHTSSTRTVATLALVGALALAAGCSGLGMDDGDAGANATVESTATDDDQPNATGGNASADDGHGHSHSHGGDSDADNGTAGDGNGTDVDGGTGAGTENGSVGGGTMNARSADASGKLTVAVDGSELDLAARDASGDGVGVARSDEHTWAANATDFTLTEALSTFGVEANASTVAVDGDRYSGDANGTSLAYRVDGESVDPTEYVLEDGDQVWVTVTTQGANSSTPGEYIRAAQQHAHGEMSFVVEGEELNFSKDKYQSNHRYFHYEHGDGETWHAHSVAITLEFALDSLTGINVSDGTVEYEGTTYDPSDDGTSVNVTVDGESVALDEYVLQDGDSVRVALESES